MGAIQRILKDQGMSIAELSRLSGVKYNTLYDITREKTPLDQVAVEKAIAIARALGTTLDDLLADTCAHVEPPIVLSDDEVRLVDLWRSTDDRGRAAIMRTAMGEQPT